MSSALELHPVWPIYDANINMGETNESLLIYSSGTLSSNFPYFSQEISNSSSSDRDLSFPTQSLENHYLGDPNHIGETNNPIQSMSFSENPLSLPFHSDNVMEDILCLKAGQLEKIDHGTEVQLKRKLDKPELQEKAGDKKKSRVISRDMVSDHMNSTQAKKGRKKTTSRKKQKVSIDGPDDDEGNAGTNGQGSSSYSSEEDSGASQELDGGAISGFQRSSSLNSNGKRATRGAATDPQSLYARRRRERINERLRILRNLVPNGTKVDISTMLEEAVHYVKFLQLQIKLLSSDDMWMYAPIAYNGLDI
ncbi:hypothetical protein NMG60_11016520, partial [Bertholletia excelsa]